MRDYPGKEEHAIRMRQVLRSKLHIGHEVACVIQRHDDHDESAQDVHRNEP